MPDLVRITVFWHRDCGEGRDLAGAIFRWFRGDPQDPGEAGRGIPVHYRCLPEEPIGSALMAAGVDAGVDALVNGGVDAGPDTGIDRAPLFHIAVPLVDEQMVVDRAWRDYLQQVIWPRADLMVPVALDGGAYQLPQSISRLNYLRLERALDPADWSWERRARIRRERLLSLLTQVIARELLSLTKSELLRRVDGQGGQDTSGQHHHAAAPPRIRVFISHAKADGAAQAEALRAAILGRGQLQAFYDESDLPIGYAFAQLLQDAAGEGDAADTQAMLAIFTDQYPTRPWCQRELRQARRPRSSGVTGYEARCWRVKPLVVVTDLAGAETRMLGEIGQAPLIAWQEDRAGRIIDTLLREILLLRYNEARGLLLLRPARNRDRNRDQDQHLGRYALNCTPDAYAAMAVALAASRAGTALTELLIPPPGLDEDAREALEALLSVGGKPVRIRTFDEVELNPS